MYDNIDTFPETDDDYVPTPACDAGDACQDSLCADHGREVQANLRATASQSWVGVIALGREIVRTQDVAERYGRGEIKRLPVEPLEPGDLARALVNLWRGSMVGHTSPWIHFAEGLLVGLGYDDGLPDDAVHEGAPEQRNAWRKGREWAEAWWEAEWRPRCDFCRQQATCATTCTVCDPLLACDSCCDHTDREGCACSPLEADDPRRWQPDPDRLPWEQPVCRDSAQRRRYQRESAQMYASSRRVGYVATQREAARLSLLSRPWEPSVDVVSADGRVVRVVDSEDGL